MNSSSVILLLGGNLGDRKANLKTAACEIQKTIGAITVHSSLYESEAWGKMNQPDYLNQVLLVSTTLSPQEVLHQALKIEFNLGRIRMEKWGARVIDIDLLYFGDKVINSPSLVVPHPGIAMRRFVLAPLVEIVPDFIHPVLNKNHRQLLAACDDRLTVNRI
ncbi:MAG: 2-amino-4-hydroxy-6-hydroxymethyldihydropteridine diphosphokinase [Cyclobacteriaceae bacterium]|nr:2-amino-4-hydroxy-6-hydroxymethyldihydropteridine diphosphokinase [Cyclobacteriaceae bacterium]